ncbi:MAG TPA: DUF4350 domain-containing protein [Anaerolineaceae bacterium]|jgi:hypothetical protein|nr:DUF4350 domain-containing protein [Anaerolineaceae bacterium]
MKAKNLLIMVGLFLIPIIARTVWYYQGIYIPSKQLQTPDFLSLEIPQPTLSTSVASNAREIKKTGSVVLDLAHANQYQITEIEMLIDELKDRGAEIVTFDEGEDLNSTLKGAAAFISIAPTMDFSGDEIQQIQTFAARGGRLLVIADPTRSSSEYAISRAQSVKVVNTLLEPYHIIFRNDYAYNVYDHEGNFRNVYLEPLDKNELTENVERVVFYASRSISSYETNLLAGDANTLSSLTDTGGDLCMVALAGNNVLAIGDLTFLTSPYYQVADNYQLIKNIGQFLMSGERQVTFDDFPNLFTKPIGILSGERIVLDQDLLAQINAVKELYAKQDLTVEFLEADDEDYDLIILGLIPPDQTIHKYLDGLAIQFGSQAGNTPTPQPTAAETSAAATESITAQIPTQATLRAGQIYITGLGEVSQSDFGFFLLKSTSNRTMLLLLADNQGDLVELLSIVRYGSLKGCYVENAIALCEKNNSGWKPTPTPYVVFEETLELTPTSSPPPITE